MYTSRAFFLGKILRDPHGLWMECNHILYLCTASGIKGLESISLTVIVTAQHDLGNADLDDDDFYLLDKDNDTLLKEPVEIIRAGYVKY